MKRTVLVAGTLLILAVGLMYVQYRSDLSAARRELRAGSQIAQTACGPVEYAVAGSGPAVLVIHGAGGGYSQVAAISELLATSGFQAIAMSRFGYLRTPLPVDASPSAQADAHACLLDALGVSKASALGLSAGAPSAIQFGLRHAARCFALVLLVPAITVPGRDVAETTPPSAFWQLVFDYVLRSDFAIWVVTWFWPEMLVETVLATPLDEFRHASGAERQRGLGVIRDIFPVSLKVDGLKNDTLVTITTTAHHLERITVPTLAISAKDDLYRTDGGAQHAAEQIPGARLILFPTGGHAWLGHDAEVRDELVTFLRGATSSQ
ncbi:alpha/beta fold hydrolase [Aromatoleum anaerobium]|uniref:Alpha/beta fold hydrolase n=1 Tax=Aromatoleum anaerobium TaxID=182180 RepID=A0ABX1PRB2_9RHOO|nr:alpha/beta hydrolase [Aromatoleum anaerobium]MCK0508456.1 alpha/beta hydrolase [Aromatoleum anaerobium]